MAVASYGEKFSSAGKQEKEVFKLFIMIQNNLNVISTKALKNAMITRKNVIYSIRPTLILS